MNIEKFENGILFDEILYVKEDKFIKVRYKNSIINIEAPTIMRIPFGIKKGTFSHILQISADEDKNEKNKDFVMFINMLERHAKENLYKDFKDKKFVTRIYKKDNFPTLVNLEIKNNTIIVNENQERVFINDYLDKSFIANIEFSYNGIWFNENRYGLSFKIDKMVIKNIEKEPKIKIIF